MWQLEGALALAALHLNSARPGRRVYRAATWPAPCARVCRQLGDPSIASKRHNDDTIVRGCAFKHYAAALAWIKCP